MLAPARGVTWKEFFLALKDRFLKDRLMDVAGSVTFFGILALFPFLLFLVTLGGLVLLAAFVGVAAGPIAHAFGGPVERVVTWLRLPIAGLLIAFVWAALYQILPDKPRKFRLLTPGSVVAVAVWLLASWGFSLYVSHFGEYNKTYGAIGGAVVMLMWMWISAMVLLAGALINAVLEELPRGRTVARTPAAVATPMRGALQPRNA